MWNFAEVLDTLSACYWCISERCSNETSLREGMTFISIHSNKTFERRKAITKTEEMKLVRTEFFWVSVWRLSSKTHSKNVSGVRHFSGLSSKYELKSGRFWIQYDQGHRLLDREPENVRLSRRRKGRFYTTFTINRKEEQVCWDHIAAPSIPETENWKKTCDPSNQERPGSTEHLRRQL